jgi:hypothetical protein
MTASPATDLRDARWAESIGQKRQARRRNCGIHCDCDKAPAVVYNNARLDKSYV